MKLAFTIRGSGVHRASALYADTGASSMNVGHGAVFAVSADTDHNPLWQIKTLLFVQISHNSTGTK